MRKTTTRNQNHWGKFEIRFSIIHLVRYMSLYVVVSACQYPFSKNFLLSVYCESVLCWVLEMYTEWAMFSWDLVVRSSLSSRTLLTLSQALLKASSLLSHLILRRSLEISFYKKKSHFTELRCFPKITGTCQYLSVLYSNACRLFGLNLWNGHVCSSPSGAVLVTQPLDGLYYLERISPPRPRYMYINKSNENYLPLDNLGCPPLTPYPQVGSWLQLKCS